MKALVLAGGGSKGSYQVGVLQHLISENKLLDYDIVCGNSVGAINAVGLLKYKDFSQSFDWLKKLWLERVDKSKIYRPRSVLSFIKTRWKEPIYETQPLRNLIEDNITWHEIKASGRRLAVGATCLDTGEYYYASENDENIQDWIIASASYPMFMKAVKINDKLWADGQLKHITPMRQAIKMGATKLDIILTSNFDNHPWTSTAKSHIPDQFIRLIDLMTSEIMTADLKFLKLKNLMVDAGLTTVDGVEYKRVAARIIMPKQELIKNALDFDKTVIKKMFNVGSNINNSIIINI